MITLSWLVFSVPRVQYAIDTHTHADHNSACKVMRERYGTQVVMHRATEAPYVDLRVDDGDEIKFGKLSLTVVYTPGHTQDAMCLLFRDRIFTGDTLLIGGCGRTDLPGGNAEWQYESLAKLKTLGDQIRVFPGHDYREAVSTLGDEKQNNPRMQIASKRRIRSLYDFAQASPAPQNPRGPRMEPHADSGNTKRNGRGNLR